MLDWHNSLTLNLYIHRTDNNRSSAQIISTEIQSRVRWVHLFDSEKQSGDVGAHFKFSTLKSITESRRVCSLEHVGNAAGLASADHSEPDYLSGRAGIVGAQQSDFLTRLNLHSVRLRTWDRDPAWNKQQTDSSFSWQRITGFIRFRSIANDYQYLLRLQRSTAVNTVEFLIVRMIVLLWWCFITLSSCHGVRRGGECVHTVFTDQFHSGSL